MVALVCENHGGHPGPCLPPAQISRRERRQVRERVDPAGCGAGLKGATAKARPEGKTSSRAVEGAGHAPS